MIYKCLHTYYIHPITIQCWLCLASWWSPPKLSRRSFWLLSTLATPEKTRECRGGTRASRWSWQGWQGWSCSTWTYACWQSDALWWIHHAALAGWLDLFGALPDLLYKLHIGVGHRLQLDEHQRPRAAGPKRCRACCLADWRRVCAHAIVLVADQNSDGSLRASLRPPAISLLPTAGASHHSLWPSHRTHHGMACDVGTFGAWPGLWHPISDTPYSGHHEHQWQSHQDPDLDFLHRWPGSCHRGSFPSHAVYHQRRESSQRGSRTDPLSSFTLHRGGGHAVGWISFPKSTGWITWRGPLHWLDGQRSAPRQTRRVWPKISLYSVGLGHDANLCPVCHGSCCGTLNEGR